MPPDLTSTINRAVVLLNTVSAHPFADNRRKLFYANLVDGLKLSLVIRKVNVAHEDPRLISAEPAEALARLLLERCILVCYLATLPGSQAVDRFEKTAHASIERKWSDATTSHPLRNVAELPDYRAMAEIVDPSGDLYGLYTKMSHIAHPRTSYPYLISEAQNAKNYGITKRAYFDERSANVTAVTANALLAIVEVAERELA